MKYSVCVKYLPDTHFVLFVVSQEISSFFLIKVREVEHEVLWKFGILEVVSQKG